MEMKMKSFDKILIFDSRMIQRNIKDGKITSTDLQKHLASLPDRSSEAENISIDSDEDNSCQEIGKATEE